MSLSEQLKQVRGVVVDRFGDWRDARMGMLPVAMPGPKEILIKCEAAALNFQDLLMIAGTYQFKPRTPFFPGSDVAGTVAAVGADVAGFSVGQKVAGLVQSGGFSQYSTGQEHRCFPLPDDIEFTKAAACSSVFATVIVALKLRGQLQAGQRAMITGAAGGVGIAAVQYARQLGAEVVALVSSDAKERAVRRVGADVVIRTDQLENLKDDLRAVLAGKGISQVDVVLDSVSGDVFDGAIRCLGTGGRLVVVGFASGRIAEVKTNYLLLKGISVVGSALKLGLDGDNAIVKEAMDGVYRDVAAGRLDPSISAIFPFSQFHEAAGKIADRKAVGKIVLVP